MDRILIEDLLIRCIIGVNDDERREEQDVLINVSLGIDLGKAGHSDCIDDTIDYRSLKKEIYIDITESNFKLIEALAERVANICLSRPLVRQVRVRVEKPSALRFARSVAVEIERRQVRVARVFISVGSNINPEKNIRQAFHLLAEKANVVGLSTCYRNEAIGGTNLPPFINGIVEIETDHSVNSIKYGILRRIESRLGRERTADKYCPRTIDLDPVIYKDSKSGEVTLLDPDIKCRAYLAVPLAELDPDLMIPDGDLSISKISASLSDQPLEPLTEFSALLRTEILHG